MMSPGPAAGYLAAGHGSNRTAHPDRRIEMHNPHANDGHGGGGVNQDRPSLLHDAGEWIEILIPNDNAGADQDDDQNGHQPENGFLPGIVFADFGKLVLTIGQHIAQLRQPRAVLGAPQVRFPETKEKSSETEEQNDADPGMNSAGRLPAAER